MLRWGLLSAACGILAGLSSALFLFLLNFVTLFRQEHVILIWFLPLAGFTLAWVYYHFGQDVSAGNHLIFEEIHDPKNVVPIKMAPFILLGTVVTHLFGGSAGREGTAVQMGASLSDQLTRWFKVEARERKVLLMAGVGAGFGAAIGAPWAGFIFGMEVISIGRLETFAWWQCLIAAFVGYYTCILVGIHHTQFPRFPLPDFTFRILFFILIAGIIFGLTAYLFSRLTHLFEFGFKKLIRYPPLRTLLAGLLIVAFFWVEGSYRYAGLGLESIQNAVVSPAPFSFSFYKSFFTALTISSGFKGGEFIPLVFVGTTLGSALAAFLPVAFNLLAALGFAAVFAGAANTPLACTVMAMEIFGYKIGGYALAACYLSYIFSGQYGIYSSQKVTNWRFPKFRLF